MSESSIQQKLRYSGDVDTFVQLWKRALDYAGAITVEYFSGQSTKAQKQSLAAVILFGNATDTAYLEENYEMFASHYDQFNNDNARCWNALELEEMNSFMQNVTKRDQWVLALRSVYNLFNFEGCDHILGDEIGQHPNKASLAMARLNAHYIEDKKNDTSKLLSAVQRATKISFVNAKQFSQGFNLLRAAIKEADRIDPTIVHHAMVKAQLVEHCCKLHPRMEPHILQLKRGDLSPQEVHKSIVKCCLDLKLGSESEAHESVKPTAMQAIATAVGGLSPTKVAVYLMGLANGGGQKLFTNGNKASTKPAKGSSAQSSAQRKQKAKGKGKRQFPTADEIEASELPTDPQALSKAAASFKRQLVAVQRKCDKLQATSANLASGFDFNAELTRGLPGFECNFAGEEGDISENLFFAGGSEEKENSEDFDSAKDGEDRNLGRYDGASLKTIATDKHYFPKTQQTIEQCLDRLDEISMKSLDDTKCLDVILGKLFDAIDQLDKGPSSKALVNLTLILTISMRNFWRSIPQERRFLVL